VFGWRQLTSVNHEIYSQLALNYYVFSLGRELRANQKFANENGHLLSEKNTDRSRVATDRLCTNAALPSNRAAKKELKGARAGQAPKGRLHRRSALWARAKS
jgi:hypothetical protein